MKAKFLRDEKIGYSRFVGVKTPSAFGTSRCSLCLWGAPSNVEGYSMGELLNYWCLENAKEQHHDMSLWCCS